MNETYSITINDNVYFVKIIEKKMKNIRLKIENNQLIISGYRLNKQKVNKIIEKNYQWILKRIDDYQKKNQIFNLEELYNFRKVYLFGEEKSITIDYKRNIYMIDNFQFSFKNQLLREFELKKIRKFFGDYLIKRFEYWCNVFKKYPKLSLKDMKSKHGYCKYNDNEICLSLRLIHLPSDVIDYVIVHEFCHFKVPNHSKNFYLEVFKYFPNYKLAIKILKGYNVVCK